MLSHQGHKYQCGDIRSMKKSNTKQCLQITQILKKDIDEIPVKEFKRMILRDLNTM
jgi:hypothetical protein